MPDEDGKLTREEAKQAIDWIESRAPNLACSACGENDFQLGEHAITGIVHVGGGVVLGGSAYPQIMTICKNCGHTVHFNAVFMGLFKREEAEEEEPPDSPDNREKADG